MSSTNGPRSSKLIGETAGAIWKYLDTSGPCTIAELIKSVDGTRDLVMQGVGWLAREEKVYIDERSRQRTIHLR